MTLLLGFAAVNTGNNLLYLLVSALLGFMAVSGWLGQQNLRKLKLTLILPQESFVNQPTLIGVRLHNSRRYLPAFLIRVDLGSNGPLFSQISGNAHAEQSLLHSFDKRGYHQIEDLWISSCFPINFFVRSRKIPVNQTLLIFPQPQTAPAPVAAGQSKQRLQLPSSMNGESGDIRSIQDYQGGEPLKSIHWKLSARHINFKVKQLEGLAAQPVIIDLDSLQGNLENRISRATGLVIKQLHHQQPVGLKLAARIISPKTGYIQRRHLLTELALYDGR